MEILLVYMVILGFLPGHPLWQSCSLKTLITEVTAKLKHVFSEVPQGLPWWLSGKESAEHRQGGPTGDGLSVEGYRDVCSSNLPRPPLKIMTVIFPLSPAVRKEYTSHSGTLGQVPFRAFGCRFFARKGTQYRFLVFFVCLFFVFLGVF